MTNEQIVEHNKTSKHYKITLHRCEYHGTYVYQVYFPEIKLYGGYIESPDNLTDDGSVIYPGSIVAGRSRVHNISIVGNDVVLYNAVCDHSIVKMNSHVYNTVLKDTTVQEMCHIGSREPDQSITGEDGLYRLTNIVSSVIGNNVEIIGDRNFMYDSYVTSDATINADDVRIISSDLLPEFTDLTTVTGTVSCGELTSPYGLGEARTIIGMNRHDIDDKYVI